MKKEIRTVFDIFETTGVAVPGIRSICVMKEEEKISLSEIDRVMKREEVFIIDDLLSSYPRWTIHPYYTRPKNKEKYVHKYIHSSEEEAYVRWDRIHGKHRKIAKFECKKEKKRAKEAAGVFNKYVGKDDVICVYVFPQNRSDKEEWIKQIKSELSFLEINTDYDDPCIYNVYLKVDPEVVQAYLKHQETVDNAEKIQS